MDYIGLILFFALTIGICYLIDKGFAGIFRNKEQHKSGLSVKVSRRYASFGIVLFILGLLGIMKGVGNSTLLVAGSVFVLLLGTALVTYYMSFGVYYDEDSFLYGRFGRKTVEYQFSDIVCQQLFLINGGTVIELTMKDGKAISLQSSMDGVYHFLDTAFAGWCRQKGVYVEDCPFYDPSNSCWFPNGEGK